MNLSQYPILVSIYHLYLKVIDSLVHGISYPQRLPGYEPVRVNEDDPIDAVYTFVDMRAPQWQEKWRSINAGELSTDRYSNHGELAFSIALLLQNCPWVNRIFIVTPTPEFVDISHSKVTIVHDDEILGPECTRPTFKSCSVESYLHNIPGLSDYFLYLCDDYFVGRKIEKSAFFGKDGMISVSMYRKNLSRLFMTKARLNRRDTENDIVNASRCISRKFNTHINLTHRHQMTIVSRKACIATWDFFREELEKSVSHPTRIPFQDTVHFLHLSQLVGILLGFMVLEIVKKNQDIYVHKVKRKEQAKAMARVLTERPAYFCFNYLSNDVADLFQTFKRLFIQDLPLSNRVFYVCSYGGCGSTMLTRFLGRYGKCFHIHSRTPPEYLTRIRKTDHFPYAKEWFSDDPVDDAGRYTVIYLYRHPTFAQLAKTGAKGNQIYNPIHHRNIQVPNPVPANINEYANACLTAGEELLGYEEFFDNYVERARNTNYDIVCVDYARLWENLEEFFLTIRLGPSEIRNFPQKKRRTKPRNNQELVSRLNDVNRQLITRIENTPPVMLIPGKHPGKHTS